MEEVIRLSIFLAFILTGLVTADQIREDDHPGAHVAFCEPYCDIYGYYKPGAWCISYDDPVYCCGDENYRECCTDPNRDISGEYEPVTECPNSSWWIYHWRVIIGLLGTLMMVLIVTSCCYYCYYCCVHAFSRRRRREASNERETELPSVCASGGATGVTFDPQHPYAFEPPDYDSLPQEPPKYAEVFEQESANANTNNAFEPDVPPPPPFEDILPENGPETPPPGYERNVPIHTTDISAQSDVVVNPFTGEPVMRGSIDETVNPSAI